MERQPGDDVRRHRRKNPWETLNMWLKGVRYLGRTPYQNDYPF